MATSSKKGIITLIIATFFLALMDGMSRYMAELYDVLNINMFRFWIIGSFVILVSLRGRGVLLSILKTKQPVAQISRGLLFISSLLMAIYSYTQVGLIVTHALMAVFPLLTVLLSGLFLEEEITRIKVVAVAVGFLGVIIVLDPSFDDFNYMELAPVACALFYAISMTITKYTSKKDGVYTQMAHLYIGAILISVIFFIFTGKGQLNIYSDPTFQFIFREWFTNPDYAWPFIVAMGFVASFSFYCVFSAYSVASPPVVSLYEYSLIIWAILIGYFLFNDIPTPRTFLGVFLIIGAGIYIYMREKARDQMIVSDTPNR